MKVKLIEYIGDSEGVVAKAAKLCYSKGGLDAIEKNSTAEENERFIDHLSNIGHGSPFEHTKYVFYVEGVSRSLSHQLVRHRPFSFSQQSQRYVNEDNFVYIIPEEIKKEPILRKGYIDFMIKTQEEYDKIANHLKAKYFLESIKEFPSEVTINDTRYERDCIMILHETMISEQGMPNNFLEEMYCSICKGVDKKKFSIAEKKAIENARYVLPNACETKIIFSANARALMHFLELRMCNRAQDEIREMANQMWEELMEVSPHIFKNAGPSCINGPCSEGAMSCGKPIKR